MSLWQHKNIHKRHLLWAKLFGICLLFHLIFLFWIFCVYRDNTHVIALSINKKMDYSAPIMFVPYGVPINTTKPKPIGSSKPAPQKPPVAQKTIVPAKNSTTIAPSKTVVAKKEPAILQQVSNFAPPSHKASEGHSKASEDTSADTAKTPIVPEKVKPAIKAEPVKITTVKKVEPKPEIKPAVKPEVKAEKPLAPKIEPPVIAPPSPKASADSPSTKSLAEKPAAPAIAKALDIQNATITPVIPENAIVSNNYREVEALRRGAQLQKELVTTWKPPIGVSPDCVCEISFSVTQMGALQDLKMIKSSGVVMYDISARQALYSMKMPRWTYNKPFTITFKQ